MEMVRSKLQTPDLLRLRKNDKFTVAIKSINWRVHVLADAEEETENSTGEYSSLSLSR